MRLGISPDIDVVRRRGFVPTDLSGCTLWLRADKGVTSSAGRVSAVVDQSGVGGATQGTGAQQPLLVAGPPTVLRADGARRLDVSGQGTPTAATWSFKMSGMVGAGQAYLMSGNVNANLGIVANFGGAVGVTNWFNSSDVYSFGTLPAGRSLHIFTIVQTNGGALLGYLDGVQVFSATATAALQGIGAVLNYITSTAGGSDGDFAGAVAYNRALSAVELTRVNAYMNGLP